MWQLAPDLGGAQGSQVRDFGVFSFDIGNRVLTRTASQPSATTCSAAISVEDGDKAGQLFFTAAGEKLLKAKLQVGNSLRESPSAFVQ
jgi:hypothetical protein